MDKKYLEEIEKTEIRWVQSLAKRKKECRENHKYIIWIPYVISDKSNYNDKVKGICHYCLTSLERYLDKEEHDEINRFRESLKNTFYI